jgi:hypothetical protein
MTDTFKTRTAAASFIWKSQFPRIARTDEIGLPDPNDLDDIWRGRHFVSSGNGDFDRRIADAGYRLRDFTFGL